MGNYLEGWKDRKQIYIPPIAHKGFEGDVIIREYIPPVNSKEEAEPEYTGKDSTVLLYVNENPSIFIERISTGEIIEISKDEFIIGKSIEADYVIKNNPTISRKHIKITKRGGEYWIEDLKSANHSYLEEEQLTEPKKIVDKMQFRLSNNEVFRFIVKTG